MAQGTVTEDVTLADRDVNDVLRHDEAVPDEQIKRKRKSNKSTVLSQFTIRQPPWAYIRLTLITPSTLRSPGQEAAVNTKKLDEITVHLYLHSALKKFLGLHGTAIPFDTLKIDDHDVWIRLPIDDSPALVAAVGGWTSKSGEGWRVKNRSAWGPVASSGRDLFEDD